MRSFSIDRSIEKKSNNVILVLNVIDDIDFKQFKNHVGKVYPHLQIEHVSSIEEAKEKIKKQDKVILELSKNIDILKELGKKKRKQKLIGFALETRDLIKNALKKLKEKK